MFEAWLEKKNMHLIIPQCARRWRERANVLRVAVHKWACVCESAVCMTTAIIILGRWSDLTPTNYVWPASQDRVPSVWCCLTPHRLVNEGASWGSQGGVCWWKGEGGGVGLRVCCFNCSLYQTSCWFTAPSPKQQTEATQGPKLGRTLAAEAPSCCYRNRAVRLSRFFPFMISSTCSPSSLLCPSSSRVLSPASLQQISSCLSLARGKCASYNPSHCSATAVTYLAAASKVDNHCLSTVLFFFFKLRAQPTCLYQQQNVP